MQQRRVGPFEVSAIGFGCMGLSSGYGPKSPWWRSERVLKGAVDAGYTFFDTAMVYGYGHNEALVGRVLGRHRPAITIASKCGMMVGKERRIDSSPANIRANCDSSLRQLRTDVIDLYYLHRWDKRTPIEEAVGAMADLVKAGKVRAIGLSEVSAATLRQANAVHPIAALQNEYSPWTRNPELGVLQACRELGVTLVAFSPVGRGFLAGGASDPAQFRKGDMRSGMPRFQGEALAANLRLFDAFKALGREAGCTPAQLCLAWLMAKDPMIVSIPGTTSFAHMRENAAAARVILSPEVVSRVDALVNERTVAGSRYPPAMQRAVDTELTP
ncbi:MAG: aldo/keto reductase, partial [Proteobacteria bacterium]|nr:aldo/keto reductase [Pseudomonadota bacterium]